MVDSLGHGAGNALRIERDSTRINIEGILPRLPRDINNMFLNLPRLQPLQRFLDRTKSSDERDLARRPSPLLRYLLHTQSQSTFQRSQMKQTPPPLFFLARGKKNHTYRVFSNLTYIPRRQILPTSRSPQMRMTCRPIMSGDSDRFGVLRR